MQRLVDNVEMVAEGRQTTRDKIEVGEPIMTLDGDMRVGEDQKVGGS